MTARHEFYNDDGTTNKPRCPECEDAFLADHADRLHCGRCGYTQWKGAE